MTDQTPPTDRPLTADAMKLSAGERAFTAWATSSRADATPLMWTWQEMPQNQRDRWETIALAASPQAREEAPAEGQIAAIVQGEYDHWIKEALKHKRTGGRRSDYEQHDLERAKVAKRILDKIAALRNRTSEPEAGAVETLGPSAGFWSNVITHPAPATADTIRARSLIEDAIKGIQKAPPSVVTDTIWTADVCPMTVVDALQLAIAALEGGKA